MKDLSNTTPFIVLAAIQRLLVPMNEKIDRSMAEYLGLKVSGTLGVLLKTRNAGRSLHSATRRNSCARMASTSMRS